MARTHWSASSDMTETVYSERFSAGWECKDGLVGLVPSNEVDRVFISGPGGCFEVNVLTPMGRGKILHALDKAYEAGVEAAREQMRAALGVRGDH